MKRNLRSWLMVFATVLTLGALVLGSMPSMAQAAPGGGQQTSAQAKKAPRAGKAKLPEGTKINVNSATVEELSKLPRVGPKMAQRIVEYRTAHKNFKSVDELRNVKGVGPKVLEGIKPYVIL
jgi:competence protein ComEA